MVNSGEIDRDLLVGQWEQMISWARFWARRVSAIFYKAYLKAASGATFLPPTESDPQMMTEVFLLRKAICELGCELNNRPDWVKIPLQGILELMNETNVAAPTIEEATSKEIK